MSTPTGASGQEASWTFLSNHAHVLLCLAMDPEVRMRSVAEKVGITERAVQKLVADLAAAGYLTRSRNGRRNRYVIHPELPLRHPLERHRSVGSLLALVHEPGEERSRSGPALATRPGPRAPPRR